MKLGYIKPQGIYPLPHANHELRKAARQKICNERHTWCGH